MDFAIRHLDLYPSYQGSWLRFLRSVAWQSLLAIYRSLWRMALPSGWPGQHFYGQYLIDHSKDGGPLYFRIFLPSCMTFQQDSSHFPRTNLWNLSLVPASWTSSLYSDPYRVLPVEVWPGLSGSSRPCRWAGPGFLWYPGWNSGLLDFHRCCFHFGCPWSARSGSLPLLYVNMFQASLKTLMLFSYALERMTPGTFWSGTKFPGRRASS